LELVTSREGSGLFHLFCEPASRSIDGRRLARDLRSRVHAPLTRFAPAPTGLLHIGHVVNAIFVWGLARSLGGQILLRIEDHDGQRCRPEFEAALLEDLEWLGFAPDVFPPREFRAGATPGRQSDRAATYRDIVAPLMARGLVYACDCSRQQIDAAVYSGRCRDRGLPLTDDVGWRVRVGPQVERFDDALLGVQEQAPVRQCGDFLIRDRRGNWTYQWAATADDTQQQITLVIRGEDLLDSTGRQMMLARLLGRAKPPVFAHHPLVMKSPTQKLSKSDGDTGVRALRHAGWDAARVIGCAARLAGLQEVPTSLAASEVTHLFDAEPA
jgi:glutamyl/glutaminyl-tRNA synthetase